MHPEPAAVVDVGNSKAKAPPLTESREKLLRISTQSKNDDQIKENSVQDIPLLIAATNQPKRPGIPCAKPKATPNCVNKYEGQRKDEEVDKKRNELCESQILPPPENCSAPSRSHKPIREKSVAGKPIKAKPVAETSVENMTVQEIPLMIAAAKSNQAKRPRIACSKPQPIPNCVNKHDCQHKNEEFEKKHKLCRHQKIIRHHHHIHTSQFV